MNIEEMSNRQLAYMLGKFLNGGYDSGGYSVGRSPRSAMLDEFFHICREDYNSGIDGFDQQEKIKALAQERLASIPRAQPIFFEMEFNIKNRDLLSVLFLHHLLRHYEVKITFNKELSSNPERCLNEIDFSFAREIELFRAIYNLYVSESGLTEVELDTLISRYDFEQLRWIARYDLLEEHLEQST